MNKPNCICLLAAVLFIVAGPAFAEKNVIDVQYKSLPANYETLLKSEPQNWNFRFRPYGSGSSQLWTDPIVARGALEGSTQIEGERPTALYVSCDNGGFSILVLCVEPGIGKAIAATNALPSPSIEFYFAPGDADNHEPVPYYQFFYGNGELRHFPWHEEDRTYRTPKPYVSVEEKRLPNGYLVKITVPWRPFFDKLPFSGKNDNIWRLSMIRWVDGGRTWGGVVHEESRAGYIRFPAFTDAQRAEIMTALLEQAWTEFNRQSGLAQYNAAGGWAAPVVRTEPYVTEVVAQRPRTYVNYGEDPEFKPVLAKIVADRKALASGIAGFAEMAPDAQLDFYTKASDMLFNFKYDVEEAYARHLEDGLFGLPGGK